MEQPKIVIVGGGFGGLYAALALKRTAAAITLLDRRNFHLFQPLLYQVATGGLSPGDIASPLRAVLSEYKNTRVLLGEMVDLDPEKRQVILRDGVLDYDILVLAPGSRNHYFGSDHWTRFAPGLKSIEEATEIRKRIFQAFEAAERETDANKRRAWLTFVVVGGGPTGVELAGTLGEIANDTLRGDFRAISSAEASILLLDGSPRILPVYPPDLSEKAERALIRLGVRCRSGVRVTAIDENGVTVHNGKTEERIEAKTVLWAAGVAASPLGQVLANRTGAKLDRGGRVLVEQDLSVAGHPEIFVIGDLAHYEEKGQPLPGVAPVAMQQGRYVARVMEAKIGNKKPPEPFHYFNKGSLATIGRAAAVADFGFVRFNGLLAWLAWLFIHLMYLVGFRNRVVVFIQWAFQYFTFNRGARLITTTSESPACEADEKPTLVK